MSTVVQDPSMSDRVARLAELRPIAAQTDPLVPQEALDLIYARRLLPVVGREATETAIAAGAPVRGAGGITITYALCPAGQGPGLHSHKATYETFTVLKGEFEIRWGDEGEHSVTLGQYDVISVPPGYSRAFRNISNEEGMLQVIISGGVHDAHDVIIPPATTQTLREMSPRLHAKMAASGITFLDVES